MHFLTKRDLRASDLQHCAQEDKSNGSKSSLRFVLNYSPAACRSHCCENNKSVPPYASMLLAGLPQSRRGGGTQSVKQKEERSGVEFPREYCHLSKTNCPVLVGIGLREKSILGVKSVGVYALGFYVDKLAVQKTLGAKYRDQPSQSLADNEELCKDVLAADAIEKTVRVVITNGMVNQKKFLGGLRESLAPACEQINDKESFAQFVELFEGTHFRKGLELAFTSTNNGGLATRIDNKDVGEVPAPGFTQAFFNMYLGPKPVSPKSKKSFSTGLASIISQTSEILSDET